MPNYYCYYFYVEYSVYKLCVAQSTKILGDRIFSLGDIVLVARKTHRGSACEKRTNAAISVRSAVQNVCPPAILCAVTTAGWAGTGTVAFRIAIAIIFTFAQLPSNGIGLLISADHFDSPESMLIVHFRLSRELLRIIQKYLIGTDIQSVR